MLYMCYTTARVYYIKMFTATKVPLVALLVQYLTMEPLPQGLSVVQCVFTL